MKLSINNIIIYFIFLFTAFYYANSQTFIDTVYYHKWGTGWQTTGRDTKYFPNNIFGPPSENCNQFSQAAGDEAVCSIGFGGEIIVGNKNFFIIDKPGPDFIIFENAFTTSNGEKIFAEPAIVSVSKDGENWTEFPFNPETLEGLAGKNWTNGGADYFNYQVSGGDAFDLEDIGIDSVRYIKIKDTSIIVTKLPKTDKYYSNMGVVTGFDLDAIVLLNTDDNNKTNDFVSLKQINNKIILQPFQPTQIKIFDLFGKEIYDESINSETTIEVNFFSNSIYFIVAESRKRYQYLKFISHLDIN